MSKVIKPGGLTGIGIGLTWNLRKNFDLIVKHLILFLTPELEKKPTNAKPNPTTVDRQLASTLYRYVHGTSFITLGHLFGISKELVCKMFHKTSRVIIYFLYETFVRIQTTDDEWADELKGFMKNYGFPCIAAWDGFHVYLSTRLKQYFSFKKRYTVTNMGLISYNKRFLYAAVGAPGSTHDSRLLKNCSLYKKILRVMPFLKSQPIWETMGKYHTSLSAILVVDQGI